MMKLYYSAGACSLASHIALHESGLAFEAISAPTKTKKLPDGSDYLAINPRGYVPLLVLEDGQTMTEGVALLLYIAQQAGADKALAPAAGSLAFYRTLEWLTFLSTEIHKSGFGPLFNPTANEEFKAAAKTRLQGRLAWVNAQLEGRAFLMGDAYSVADIYLFVCSNWAKPTGIDLSPYPHLLALRERVAARPAVQAALQAEGLTG